MKHRSLFAAVVLVLLAILLSAQAPARTLAEDPVAEAPGPAAAYFQEYPVPTPGSHPERVDVDANSLVWFTEREGFKIASLNSKTGAITEYATSGDPRDIAANVINGKIYFTEGPVGATKFGVLNPVTGAMTQVPVNYPSSSAEDCTVDPAGSFWFNGWDSQRIWRVTGVSKVVFVAPIFWYTSGLTEDPEGNLWMTGVGSYEASPRLMKLDPGVGWTEFPLPFSPATIRRPLYANGRIWFLVQDLSQIGSYDPDTGAWAFYPTPTPNAGPGDLAVDRWGRIWFSEVAANAIGVLNLRTGVITEFAVPTPGSEPLGIAVDLTRDIVWFTERAGNKIGRLILR